MLSSNQIYCCLCSMLWFCSIQSWVKVLEGLVWLFVWTMGKILVDSKVWVDSKVLVDSKVDSILVDSKVDNILVDSKVRNKIGNMAANARMAKWQQIEYKNTKTNVNKFLKKYKLNKVRTHLIQIWTFSTKKANFPQKFSIKKTTHLKIVDLMCS